ncbi:phosphoribosylformylglycinamidine synthase isoform X1 [Schistocerca americana]|uniref:phosphoribosylformylglycinamidine synthase isoform X1 n=2 Tax=Schistocerca americana TaxID=7009 RepID=UPI001F4F12F8|nr:phosphoribosylformylglycinamidine synthase isoform X1 [Schistocerca americana]
MSKMDILYLYKKPGLSVASECEKLKQLRAEAKIEALHTEICFYVEISKPLSTGELEKLKWILGSPFKPDDVQHKPYLQAKGKENMLIEIGPRLNFSTAFSSNAVSMCKSVGLQQITRLEASTRYLLSWRHEDVVMTDDLENKLVAVLHDRMTQCRYVKPIKSFDLGIRPEPWFEVDVMTKGRKALEDVNTSLGLAFDNWDLDFYTDLFKNKLKRNPSTVECFDLAQSNSEHSRHWFFKGRMIIDGEEQKESLIDMIIDTQNSSNQNNVIKFNDNSSAIEGFQVKKFHPKVAKEASNFEIEEGMLHIVFTAETHNFPTGVAPFSGATTGTGGRIRDVHAVGRGGHYIAGTAGYSVGNLLIPDYNLPWEEKSYSYPDNFARPLEILVEASNGASDYGNKFGEPVICGFARTFGMEDLHNERREWIKPIMFSGGVGALDADMIEKMKPEKGMKVVKIGGPVYRIGVGGGAASSVEVQGDNKSELDFGAVQRGDAEMEQKLHRFIRACLEMGSKNPICSIHDQGAGGNGNVLKELVEPNGAVIFTRCFQLGDPTISTLELWGAEYQENDAFLCRPEDVPLTQQIANRERCPINFVGTVLDNGKVILSEEEDPEDTKYLDGTYTSSDVRHPVDLELELVLGKMPRKVFHLQRQPGIPKSLSLPASLSVLMALERVLRLPAVASKRYLTNKVDRCVTGLIARQQCVGPLHTPAADVAVTALSIFGVEGVATAIGEQPIKGLVNAAAGARMTVAECLTNLVFARISDIQDVKCSGNWMWAAKLPGEGAALHDACVAMCRVMAELGVAVDGGKDSLSMAARVSGSTVKAPGTLVVSAYAPCPDVRQVVTPDLKSPSVGRSGLLFHVDLSGGCNRLGGSALAQCFRQLGDSCPDLEQPSLLKKAFGVTQKLIKEGRVLSGHDISDGGLITCLLEMAFCGISGLNLDITHKKGDPVDILFAEEVGWVLEVDLKFRDYVATSFKNCGVPCHYIGDSVGYGIESPVKILVNGNLALKSDVYSLFRVWEETSYQLERRQANPDCVRQEFENLARRRAPKYRLTFDPNRNPDVAVSLSSVQRVAVIREEGINGDREMAASLHMAGFEVWDVTMQDLLDKKVTVDIFRGVIFPGGFSYADVLGSAKGWAASLLFHPSLRAQFQAFAAREDTFSLGVCNGCQLMSLLGWIGTLPAGSSSGDSLSTPEIVLDHNLSGRFECRFSTVKIERSPSIMLHGMEGCLLGVWIAHGEGRFTFRDENVYTELEKNKCLAIKYVDDDGKPTLEYPLNPNGSIGGVAGICSDDGRHLAMMPHPERCTQLWQWPWLPQEWKGEHTVSPWMRMFQNAYWWCVTDS